MRLTQQPGRYTCVRLGGDTARPKWARGRFVSVTRTPDELSIVCDFDRLPPEKKRGRAMRVEGPFVLLKVEGPLAFDQVGVLAALVKPLAESGIPLLTISTFNTDYLLIAEAKTTDAAAAFRSAGHELSDG